MTKILVFIVLLASSPAFSLLEQLYQVDNECQKTCNDKFSDSYTRKAACRAGCEYKILDTDCDTNCEKYSPNKAEQQICKVSCQSSKVIEIVNNQEIPPVAVDPVPEGDQIEGESSATEIEQPHSIILIRLREKPLLMMPSPPESMIDMDPRQMFRDIIERFHQRIEFLQKNFEESFGEQAPEETLREALQKDSPILFDTDNLNDNLEFFPMDSNPNDDSNNDLSDSLIRAQNRLNEFIRRQSHLLLWSLVSVLLLSSFFLFYMIITICGALQTKYVPVEQKEIYFQSFGYDGYTKENIQPNDYVFEEAEPLPIKVKLSTI